MRWQHGCRIVPTGHPAINLFDRVAAAEDFDALYPVEALSNERMPEEHAALAKAAAAAGDDDGAARVVADYIAGMTDRFALQTRDALRAKV